MLCSLTVWSDWSGEESCPSPCWGTYRKSRTCRDPNKDNATILAEKCGTEPDTVDNVDCPVNDTCWKVIQSRGQHGNGADYFMRTWAEYVAGFGVEGRLELDYP